MMLDQAEARPERLSVFTEADPQAASQVVRALEASDHTPQAFAPLDRLLAAMPPDVADGFTNEQYEALAKALAASRWSTHPVDIRLGIPLLTDSYYLRVVGGPERRSAERLKAEAAQTKNLKTANLAFFGSFALTTLALSLLMAMGMSFA
ncbi:MAG: hypothetical protein ACFB6S_14280 [Geminicoccaceae bacterium]